MNPISGRPGLRQARRWLMRFAVLALAWAGAQAEPLRIAGNFPAAHSSSVAMVQFKADVEKGSQGQLSVELFPAMQMGGAQDNVEQVRKGELFMTWVSTAYLSRTVPELAVLGIPFLFSDRAHAFKVVDGPLGNLLAERMAAQNLQLLGFMELGPRQLTSRKPVRSLADLKGLKIRLQPDPIHLATFRALGAEPVTLDIKEVYGALQSGQLDAEENPFAVIRDRNFDQVQKHLANTSHFFDFIVLVANKRRYDALAALQRQMIKAAADKAVLAQRTAAAGEDMGAIVELGKRGMQFEPVRPSFRNDMLKATEGVVDQVRQKVGKELVDATLHAAH